MSAGAAPRVSVLVPCWNAAGSIERALASVLEDPGADLECIVVDDGSTDGTADVVRSIAARDARLALFEAPVNEGVSAARNRGLEAVRGEWLTLLDADDNFLPGGLARLVAVAKPDVLAVIGQQVWSDRERTWVGPLYDIPDIREPGRKSLARNPGLLYYVSPHGKLLHRSTWEGLRFSGRVLGDQPWVIRALLRAGDRMEVIGDTVYEWYRPAADTGPSTITSRTRTSADRGVEAARVAAEAFAAVAGEAEARLDPAARDAVLTRYAERLFRSDLAFHLAYALGRADPTIDRLLDAIRGFVGAIPPRYALASDALAVDILDPPLARWHRVDGPGRRAYWRLVAAARAVDRGIGGRLPSRRGRLALGLEERLPVLGTAAADMVLALARIASGIGRRLRPEER